MEKQIILVVVILLTSSVKAQQVAGHQDPIDTTLKYKLESIRVADQTLRLVLPEVEKKFGKDSKETKYFWSLIHQQDSINEKEVTKIIDNYGWLGYNRIGGSANQSLWLVIQHAPVEIQEKYVPYLKESVEKGESQGWYLAFLEDRILMRNGEKQIYGTQAVFNRDSGKTYIYPIQDVKDVNMRRTKLGLETIEEYSEKNGYVFEPDKY
ncbi:MAG: hypothetical protein EOM90_10060 [Alphaproteobacteria bacterium]|nr:hypothetical protein [Alphaproteobacteria bacterium]